MKRDYLDLIYFRSILNLKAEASRYFLGVLWWVIEPVLYLAVFYFVFEMGLRSGGEGFVSFLLCGLVSWKWFDNSIKSCAVSITQNVGIMYQLYLPKFIFPLIAILTGFFRFLIILLIFILFLLLNDIQVQYSWFWLPFVIFVQLLLILGAGLLVAAVVPLVPDLRHIVNYTMLLLFFSSGIFFDINSMSPEVQDILVYNPFMVIIDSYRSVLLDGESPRMLPMLIISGSSFVLLLINFFIYRQFDRAFPRLVN